MRAHSKGQRPVTPIASPYLFDVFLSRMVPHCRQASAYLVENSAFLWGSAEES